MTVSKEIRNLKSIFPYYPVTGKSGNIPAINGNPENTETVNLRKLAEIDREKKNGLQQ